MGSGQVFVIHNKSIIYISNMQLKLHSCAQVLTAELLFFKIIGVSSQEYSTSSCIPKLIHILKNYPMDFNNFIAV